MAEEPIVKRSSTSTRPSQRQPARRSRTYKAGRRLKFEQLDARRLLAVVFGDFNGDGRDDMAVGSPGESVGNLANAGAVNIIYGRAGGLHYLNDQIWHQDSPNVEGVAEAGDRFGASLAVGDFNGDGYDDLAIGAPGEAVGDLLEAGAVNILYGSANGLTAAGDQILHQDVNGMQEVAEAMDRFGAVLSSGDYDGDGYDDLAIGVPHENVGGQQDAGIVQILYGTFTGLRTTRNQIFQQGAGGMNGMAERYDFFGGALASGDFNNDGRDDLAVGAPGEDTTLFDVGGVNVIYGTASGLSSANNQFYTQDSSGVPDVAEAWDNFGSALAAGDFDGDGYDDLAIGSPNEDLGASGVDAGAVHVMYGRAAIGFNPTRHQMWHQDSEWIEGAAEANDYYGATLAAGDFNGDGRDDLAIGVPGEAVGNLSDAGAVNLMYGYASGLGYLNDRIFYQDTAGVEGVSEALDYFGATLAVGDTNNDGYADLAVGVPGENIGNIANAGVVQVFHGQNAYGLRTDNDTIWHQDTEWIEGVAEAGDAFGGDKPQSMAGGVPAFQSLPGAAKHLFLDFNGGTSNNIYTTYFKLDDLNATNWTERSMIEDIWATVAEDFAPFNINVTTVYPVGVAASAIFRVLIGGDGSERQTNPTSGWGPGDFTDNSSTNNDVYVYSKRIQSWQSGNGVGDDLAARIGTTASHEAGHGFGLGHKSTYHAFGALLDEYSDGGADWTPIMGGNLSTDRTIWTESWVALTFDTNAQGSDDFGVLQSELGLRADDHASSLAGATYLGSIGASGMLMDTGLIRTKTDLDMFRFQVTTAGTFHISVKVADVGANLNSILQLRNSGGVVIATSDPNGDLNATISKSLSAGTYYVTVGGDGVFSGDVGQYTLRVQPGLVFKLPETDFVLEFNNNAGGTADGSRLGAHDMAVAPEPTMPPLVQPDPVAERNEAVDALMAEWSRSSVKQLQRLGAPAWLTDLPLGEEEDSLWS